MNLDLMIPRRGDENRLAILRRQTRLVAGQNAARRLAGRADHRERARQFAVQRLEGMQPAPAETKFETVVAIHHHIEQAVGRTRVGIVVHCEEKLPAVKRETEWIPQTRGEQLQLAAIRPAAKYISTFPLAAVRRTVAAFQRVAFAQIFALTDVEPAFLRPAMAAIFVVPMSRPTITGLVFTAPLSFVVFCSWVIVVCLFVCV